MKTSELAKAVALETGMNVHAAEKVMTALFGVIKKEVASGHEVKIFKFGTFSVAELGERKRRNPRTGELLFTPARRRCLFHSSRVFKRELNNSKGTS